MFVSAAERIDDGMKIIKRKGNANKIIQTEEDATEIFELH